MSDEKSSYSRKRSYSSMAGPSGASWTRRVLYKPRSFVKARRNRAPRYSMGELKYKDLTGATYAGDTTGTVTALNLVAVGDDNTDRDGRQVHLHSVHIQGVVRPVDAQSGANFSRLMLIWDSQPNGALPSITDILVSSTSLSGTNLNNRERFTILRDKRYEVGGVSDTATQSYTISPGMHVINEYVKLKGIKTTYSGTTATIGSVSTGALLMVTISNLAAGLGSAFDLSTRVRFYDA